MDNKTKELIMKYRFYTQYLQDEIEQYKVINKDLENDIERLNVLSVNLLGLLDYYRKGSI